VTERASPEAKGVEGGDSRVIPPDPPSSGSRRDVLRGLPGSPGIAIGAAVILDSARTPVPKRRIARDAAPAELARFTAAVGKVEDDLRAIAARSADRLAEASILEAYVLMVADPALAVAVRRGIEGEGRGVEWAVAAAIQSIAGRLASVDDAYLRERSHDVEFVGDRLLRALSGTAPTQPLGGLDATSIIVAHDLSPADTAAMVREPVAAFVTELGTRTSHTAIMARALEIPAVLGTSDATRAINPGDLLIVDGLRGLVIVRPTPADLVEARARSARYEQLAHELTETRDRPAETRDHERVRLSANIELPGEAVLAKDIGAQGIGLYRTEYIYISRETLPTEEEQLAIYQRVVEATAPGSVTLRTFDVGGDKFASTFQLPPEINPMLGLRAVRLALSRPEVFLVQLRAMVRASAFGEVRIMIPMVSGLGELREVRGLLDRAIAEVRSRGLPCAEKIPLGVMIEVPAAAMMADVFAREAAFMSLGTNDLVQYALAVDRTSRSLAYLASALDPGVLRLIARVVDAGEAHGCPVSVCGAMASDPLAATLLLGLGVRELSMEAAAIPTLKEAIGRVSMAEAEAVAMEALRLSTAEEIEHTLAEAFAPRFYDLLSGDEGD
jgi:phosphotransferase system enzyme I (PtsI)